MEEDKRWQTTKDQRERKKKLKEHPKIGEKKWKARKRRPKGPPKGIKDEGQQKGGKEQTGGATGKPGGAKEGREEESEMTEAMVEARKKREVSGRATEGDERTPEGKMEATGGGIEEIVAEDDEGGRKIEKVRTPERQTKPEG